MIFFMEDGVAYATPCLMLGPSMHTRTLWARNVDATHVFLILDAIYSTLNEGWLKFESMTSYHASFWYNAKKPTQPQT